MTEGRQFPARSAVALAKASTPTNSDILKNQQGENINPTLDTLKKIAKALGVGLDELTGYQLRGKPR